VADVYTEYVSIFDGSCGGRYASDDFLVFCYLIESCRNGLVFFGCLIEKFLSELASSDVVFADKGYFH